MVRGKNHDRILGQIILFQKSEHLTHIIVNAANHAEILGQGTLTQFFNCIGRTTHPTRSVLQCSQYLAHGHRLLKGQMIVHRIIGSPNGIGPVGIGQGKHQTERLALIAVENLQGTIDQPISGEALFIRIAQIINWISILLGCHLGAAFGHFKFLPMPTVEHKSVIGKSEFTGRCPTGLRIPIQVPLTQIRSGVTPLAKNFGKGDDGILKGQIITGRSCGLGIESGNPGRTGRRAYRGGGKVIGTNQSIPGQGINVRSIDLIALAPDEGLVLIHLFTIATEGTEVMLIRLNDNYIGLASPKGE